MMPCNSHLPRTTTDLLLKGAQYFYTLAQNSKENKAEKQFFSKKSYFIAIYYRRVLNIFTLLLKTVNKIKQKKSFCSKKSYFIAI